MAALKSAPVTTVSLARFVLETQLKRCDKMKRDGWCSEWGIGQSLDWWSGLKNQKQKAKYGMYLCALLIDKQNEITPPPAHATIYRNVSALPCAHIVPGPQILNAPIAPVQYFQGHEPTVNTYSNSQSIAKYHHCFKDFKDQESSGNGFASFVDLYAVRHAEKRHYQTVSATRIAAVDGATGNVPNPHANLTAPSAMSTPAGNTSHGNPPTRGHCHGCKQEGHWVNKCPDKIPGYRNKRNSNRRQAFNRDAKLMEQMREFFAAMNVKDQPA